MEEKPLPILSTDRREINEISGKFLGVLDYLSIIVLSSIIGAYLLQPLLNKVVKAERCGPRSLKIESQLSASETCSLELGLHISGWLLSPYA
jgi:hypothetical protein